MPAMQGKGGPWTERKLAAVRKYLQAFNTALSKRNFTRVYADAFAGSGSRELDCVPLLDDDLDIARIAKGSARIALESKPSFHRFIFIEKTASNVASLRGLRPEFPELDVQIRKFGTRQHRESLGPELARHPLPRSLRLPGRVELPNCRRRDHGHRCVASVSSQCCQKNAT